MILNLFVLITGHFIRGNVFSLSITFLISYTNHYFLNSPSRKGNNLNYIHLSVSLKPLNIAPTNSAFSPYPWSFLVLHIMDLSMLYAPPLFHALSSPMLLPLPHMERFSYCRCLKGQSHLIVNGSPQTVVPEKLSMDSPDSLVLLKAIELHFNVSDQRFKAGFINLC